LHARHTMLYQSTIYQRKVFVNSSRLT
jgi:hypothetical protein